MRKKPEKTFLERIPVPRNDKIILLSVARIVSVVAEGRFLRLSAVTGESCEIDYRLKDLEARLDPAKFIRLSRRALANVEFIRHAEVRPNGIYLVVFDNDRELSGQAACSRKSCANDFLSHKGYIIRNPGRRRNKKEVTE